MSRITRRPIAVSAVAGLAAMSVGLVANPWSAQAVDEVVETSFVPLTPCRAIDTRSTEDRVGDIDRLVADTPVTVRLAGPDVGECGGSIPASALAVSANVSAVDGSNRSFFTVWPTGADQPTASILNWEAGTRAVGNEVRITLGADGASNVENAFGDVDLVVDIDGYYVERAGSGGGGDGSAEVDELRDRVDELERLLDGVLRADVDGHDTLVFPGMNLQVHDGAEGGTYATANGLGNLIVGKNETQGSDVRTGSNNLVVGGGHTWTRNGTFVAGFNNGTTANGASVSGGRFNTATARYSSVTGGQANDATAEYATVSGGQDNEATAEFAAVSGGSGNDARGEASSVSGGANNTAEGSYSSVSGGGDNYTPANYSSITGGTSNTASGTSSVVVGGTGNSVSSDGPANVQLGGDGDECHGPSVGVCGEGTLSPTD